MNIIIILIIIIRRDLTYENYKETASKTEKLQRICDAISRTVRM